jgi:hypothetical protein
MRYILSVCLLTVALALASRADAPYPNRLQLSGSPVGGVTVDASQIVGRTASGDTDGLDPDQAAQVLVSDIPDADTLTYQDTTPTIDIASPVLIAVTVGTTAGAYTLTPGVAMTITDAWAVSASAGASGDTIRVSIGSQGALTDAMSYSATSGYSQIYRRPAAWTSTVADVAAGEVITVTTAGSGSVAAGVLYLLGYRQGSDP